MTPTKPQKSVDKHSFRWLNEQYDTDGSELDTLPGEKPNNWKRLFTMNGKLVDRTVLRVMNFLFQWGSDPNLEEEVGDHLKDAVETYQFSRALSRPDQYFLPDDLPIMRTCPIDNLPNGQKMAINFESVFEPYDESFSDEFHSYFGNESCRVHYWRHDTVGNPTIIFAHSWCGGSLWLEEMFVNARHFYEKGYNLAFMTLPFHGKRTPEQAMFSGQLFPSTNIKLTLEAFGQSLHDIHVLYRWLRKQESTGPIGMMGFSLGGYLTTLMASFEDQLDFAIPIISPASFADILWFHGENKPLRESALEAGIDLADLRELMSVFCPLSYPLQIPREDTFIVAGLGDEVVPPCHSMALWEHWNHPQIKWYAGSHLLHIGRSGYLQDISNWLDERMDDRATARKTESVDTKKVAG